MNFQDYRTLFCVVTLAFVLLAASPTLNIVAPLPESGVSFSEIWLLRSNNMTGEYSFNVVEGESHSLLLVVGSHLGHLAYYRVYVRLNNQTQFLSNFTASHRNSLSNIYEYQFFVAEGGVWETSLTFEILNASRTGNVMTVEDISVDERTFQVGIPSFWDSNRGGFYFQLSFELWLYNTESSSFQFDDRFVAIWLNVTG